MDKDNMNKDNMNKDNMDGKDKGKGKDIDDKPQTFIDMKNHYEIEYLHFMINILEPFIEFKSGQSNDVTIIFKGKEASENKVINTKQFIHFIQITFPNFIKDEKQIWLIDWEYAGFNTPLFDLGGLASNNDFNENQEKILLENYYEEKLSDEKLFKYKCIKCASLLRETMWSMVSEIQSNIKFDYKSYTNENLTKFSSVFEEIQ